MRAGNGDGGGKTAKVCVKSFIILVFGLSHNHNHLNTSFFSPLQAEKHFAFGFMALTPCVHSMDVAIPFGNPWDRCVNIQGSAVKFTVFDFLLW